MHMRAPQQAGGPTPRDAAEPQPARERAVLVAGLAAAVAEGAVLTWFMQGSIGAALLLLAHSIAIGMLAALMHRARGGGRDLGGWMLLLIPTIAIGPAGALVGVALHALPRDGSPRARARLVRWYERISLSTAIDGVTQLCDRVAVGRTIDLSDAPPRPFTAVMQQGTLAERQAALGHVARHFHPHYLPALTLALRSPESVIRVQAAAVATRVRAEITLRIDHALALAHAAEPGLASCIDAIGEIEAILDSGLMDELDRRRAASVLTRLRGIASCGLERRHAAAALAAGSSPSRSESLEHVLIEQRRFKALRQVRVQSALRRRGDYRVRPLPRRRRATPAGRGTREGRAP
jgi:hypothetical protein